jgi:phosphoribosylformylglycinamidine synthase
VRGTLTPQLKPARPGDTTLLLVDLGGGRARLGGSVLAQTLGGRLATRCRTWTTRRCKSLVAAVNALRAQGRLLAYHDRSDGGL